MQVNLVFLKKDGTTSSFELPSTVTSIGRRQDCDFCIPLMVVSRKHCEVNQDAGKITVRDLNSRNGTLVNGQPIEEQIVKAGDVLTIGPVKFVVQIDGQPNDFESYLQQDKVTTAAEAAADVQTFESAAADYAEQDMEALAEPELSSSQTELQSDFFGDFDLDEELEL